MSAPPLPVALVGAGPGDPLLLTRRAARLLGAADVVVVDRPSIDPILTLARPEAERVYVGRAPGQAAWTTDAIADLIAERATAGRQVVRLKSGDPFVCARGAEEVAALAARGIRCELTPGVSAATAVPLAAGPRFARGTTVTIASGDRDAEAAPVPWDAVARSTGSLVVLTGRSQQGAIADRLQAAGLPGDTPAAVVHGARRADCSVVTTTLDRLGGTRLPPPAGFVVGPRSEGVADAHP